MKLLRKFTSMLCLFSLLATLGQAVAAQQTSSTQPPSPTAKESSPGTPSAADQVTPKPPADAAFRGVKVADAKGKQTDATLIFSDTNKNLLVRVADRDFLSIPYDQIDKFSYEYTKKHRVTQGAIVMVASLGAGAIVMLTKSKSHWLYIDFHEQNASKSAVLRLDKREYKTIFEAVKTHTGKVEFIKDAGGKSKKEADKDEGKNE